MPFWSAKSIVVAAILGMSLPAGSVSRLVSAEQITTYDCAVLQITADPNIQTGVTHQSLNCNYANNDVTVSGGAGELVNTAFVFNGATFASGALRFQQNVRLGKGSSIRVDGGSFYRLRLASSAHHPTSSVYLHNLVFSDRLTVGDNTAFQHGKLTVDKITAPEVRIGVDAQDAEVVVRDVTTTGNFLVMQDASFTRSKFALEGSLPVKNSNAMSKLAGVRFQVVNGNHVEFTDSEFKMTNVMVVDEQFNLRQTSSSGSSFTFTDNVFDASFSSTNTDLKTSKITFRGNKFFADNSGQVLHISANEDSSVDFDATNFVDGSRGPDVASATIDLIGTKDSTFALEGSIHKVKNLQITMSNAVNTGIRLHECIVDNAVRLNFDGSTGTKVVVDKIRAEVLNLRTDNSNVNVDADVKITNNHEIGRFRVSGVYDNAAITFDNNKFRYESESEFRPSTFKRSNVKFINNELFALSATVGTLSLGNIVTAAASTFALTGNTFGQPNKAVASLTVQMFGSKIIHDTTNHYAGGSVYVASQSGNGNVFAIDGTNVFGKVEFTQFDGVNGDIQLRGITADAISAYLAGSSHTTVVADALTTNTLTIDGIPSVSSIPNLNSNAAASFMTISVAGNANVDRLVSTNGLNLRDSNVTIAWNTFASGLSLAKAEFVRTRSMLNSNTIYTADFAGLTNVRGSELVFRKNRFTAALSNENALLITEFSGMGRIDFDASNVFAGGFVSIASTKNTNSKVVIAGQTLSGLSVSQMLGEGDSVELRDNIIDLVSIVTYGTQGKVHIEGNTAVNGVRVSGDVDRVTSEASITIVKNNGISSLRVADMILVDSTVSVADNEFTSLNQDSVITNVALKNTPVSFVANRVVSLLIDSPAAKDSPVTINNNVFLQTDETSAAFAADFADGCTLIHDSTNAYYGGLVSVQSVRGVNNVFVLEGIQHHGDGVSFVEQDGVNANVVLRDFTAAEVTVAIEGGKGAKVLIDSVTAEEIRINGGLGLFATDIAITVQNSVVQSVSTTNLNLDNSRVLFAKNRLTAAVFVWGKATLTNTCVSYDGNSFQFGLNMASVSIVEGSSLSLVNNKFWESDPASVSLAAAVGNNGRLVHDASNKYVGGSIAITSDRSKGSVFVLEGKRTFGAVSYTESSVGTDAFVSIKAITVGTLTVDLGHAHSSSALIDTVTVTGDLIANMVRASDSYIGIEKSSLRGATVLGGSLRANSHYWVRASTSTAPVSVAAATACSEGKPCRVEIIENKVASKADGTPIAVVGAIGDYTTLVISKNKIGSSATGLGIAFTAPAALTGSASLVISENTASRFAALQKALYFASPYTFTGSADVWGNAFISGAIRLKLGASPAKFNIVNNRADFFLVTGAAPTSSSRVSACNTFSGNDKEVDMMGAGFKTAECEASTVVGVCGGSRTQAATETGFSACSAAIKVRVPPAAAVTCAAAVPSTPAPATTTTAPSAGAGAGAGSNGGLAPSQQGSNSLFLQSAGAASVWASFAIIAAVGAMMAL